MPETQDLQITRAGAWPVLKYNVRKPQHWNATVFLDDHTGIIVIDTDFDQQDTYSHWWGPQGRGTKTLIEFLTQGGKDSYLKDKFSYGRSRFSIDRAEEQIRARCDELMASGQMEEDEREDILDHLFGNTVSSVSSNEFYWHVESLYGELYSTHAFHKYFGNDYFFGANIGGVGANVRAENMVKKVLHPLIDYWKQVGEVEVLRALREGKSLE